MRCDCVSCDMNTDEKCSAEEVIINTKGHCSYLKGHEMVREFNNEVLLKKSGDALEWLLESYGIYEGCDCGGSDMCPVCISLQVIKEVKNAL